MTGSVAAASLYPVVPYQYYARTGSGHTPSRKVEEYWQDCDIPWVTTADVKHLRDGRRQVLDDTEFHLNQLGIANSAAREHPTGTVALSRTASVGFAAIMGRAMATSQDFVTWTPGSGLDSRFLLWVLRAMKGAGDFDRLMYGSTHKTIYVPDLQRLRGPLPPVEAQRRIADHLDTETARIDRLVALQSRALQLMDERSDAVVYRRIMDECGTDVPIRYHAKYINGYPFKPEQRSDEGLPIIRIAQLLDESIERDRFAGEVPPEQRIDTGDLVFSWSATLAARIWQGGTAHLNQHLFKVEPVLGVDKLWLRYALEAAVHQLKPYMHGSTMTHITRPMMSIAKVPTPGFRRQIELARVIESDLSRLTKLRSAARHQVELLEERRKALITAAVTGEIEV